jgi:hypothetical protein
MSPTTTNEYNMKITFGSDVLHDGPDVCALVLGVVSNVVEVILTKHKGVPQTTSVIGVELIEPQLVLLVDVQHLSPEVPLEVGAAVELLSK